MGRIDWQQQHVIVTGGSSGIGKATAQLLANRGANITIVARDPNKLAQAQQDIAAAQAQPTGRIVTLAADVANRTEAETAMQKAIEALGTPAALITCAGIAHPGYFRELPIDIFEQTMAINYFGTLYCLKAVLPSMEAAHSGHIAIVSSGAGLIGIYGYTPYSPSKFALRGLAESVRGELKPWGIHTSIVYPPDTDTPQLIAENRTKPPETKQITATAKTWTAAGVAAAIVTGMENRSFLITPGQEMSVLARLHSVIAPGLNWYFDRIVAKTGSSQNS